LEVLTLAGQIGLPFDLPPFGFNIQIIPGIFPGKLISGGFASYRAVPPAHGKGGILRKILVVLKMSRYLI
jgi:hypothetical protein